jgi:hypothetical protein
MKNLLLATLFLISTVGINLSAFAAKSDPVKKTEISVKDEERAKVLNERLTEINEMDKSALSPVERRELRKEVKAIKEELAQLSGGVYLSIGAIIVVLLLLILLL